MKKMFSKSHQRYWRKRKRYTRDKRREIKLLTRSTYWNEENIVENGKEKRMKSLMKFKIQYNILINKVKNRNER